MPEVVNPYAPPADLTPPQDADSAALEKLRAPSLGLLAVTGLTAIGGLCMLPLTLLAVLIPAGLETTPPPLGVLLMVPSFVASYFICFGAWKMRQGMSYRLAYVAALLGCIPVSYCSILSVPFGIWALIVLHRSDVKAAFAAKAGERAGAPTMELP